MTERERTETTAAEAALAAATARRADAEAAVEAATAMRRAVLSSQRARGSRVGVGLLAVSSALLALDVLLHDSTAVSRWRMRRRVQAQLLPPDNGSPSPQRLLHHPLEPASGEITMLVGPTGCGKSTLLGELARAAATGAPQSPKTPAILVQLKMAHQKGAHDDTSLTLEGAAQGVFRQIGFPSRGSLLGGLLSRGVVRSGGDVEAVVVPSSVRRLQTAFEMLFDVMDELGSAAPADAPKPLLLLDDVHDLIRNDRLARAGGKLLFDVLGTLAVRYGVDQQSLRVVMAGSDNELAQGSLLGGDGVVVYSLADPEPATVREALTAGGRYSEADAAALVDLCGPRMRLLHKALNVAHPPPAAVLLDAVRQHAYGTLAAALDKAASCGQSAALAALLDDVEAAEASGQHPFPRLPAALPPMFEGTVPSLILHRDSLGHLHFQSRAHRKVWADLRRAPWPPRRAGAAPRVA